VNEVNSHQKEEFVNFWQDKVDFVDIKVLANFNKVISTGENKWSCLDPFRRISIMANGDVIPCCSFHGKNLVLGNVKNRSIKELWKSSEIRDVRKNLIENKEHVCKLCQELS
jgi:radical SAM protein with 4Fe4S-binding SPASM domain